MPLLRILVVLFGPELKEEEFVDLMGNLFIISALKTG
jgi:hypothetical protein